ncbi:MAG: calcium/sodium antiporter [Candidatus Peregrinibacteria bacterium]|nr:calcium/sodium antiporter [Candidatus Peregrinibacteria bacterium]MDZ4244722.1 calcium/sodium antiporter [Candidatus Gracilibacteria bacterium]
MEILLWFGGLFLSLGVLVKSSDAFTEYAERLGKNIGLSPFIIGATIVSVGTSMPEMITSLIASLSGEPELAAFAIDNIIGSNIANALLVIGLSAIIVKGLNISKVLIDVDLPFLFIASSLFILLIMDGDFTWKDGIISSALAIIFLLYTLGEEERIAKEIDPEPRMLRIFHFHRKESTGLLITLIVLSAGFIFVGGKGTVDAVLRISELLHWDSSLLTLIIVALGTSLPEIVVSVVAALKGNHAIAIGNAFGSNIFNVLLVSSVPSFFTTLTVSDLSLRIGIPFFIVASLACMFTTLDNKVRFWEGWGLLVLYGAFVAAAIGLI